jgi:hypothetical protein
VAPFWPASRSFLKPRELSPLPASGALTPARRSLALAASSHPSLARVEPVSVSTGIPAGKTFAAAGDRGGIFGNTSRLHATETALSRVCGCKATES